MRKLIAYVWQKELIWRLANASGVRIDRKMQTAKMAELNQDAFPGNDAASHFNWVQAGSLHAAILILEDDERLRRSDALKAAHGVTA